MPLKSIFIATNRTHALLCQLLGDYIAQRDTRPNLAALKEELGPAEYANFESDLRALMFKRSATGAVKVIIVESVKRRSNEETFRARGPAERRTHGIETRYVKEPSVETRHCRVST